MKLEIELPPRPEQIAFNRKRWQEVVHDPDLAELPYKIETNAHGTVLMTPPASGSHSRRQSEILIMLQSMLGGRALAECPISTIDGVRAADVGWYSDQRFAIVRDQIAFEVAPEICVEVLSRSNTSFEMAEKKQLYFEAGAEEVWFCDDDGRLTFFNQTNPAPIPSSIRCPNFPDVM